MITRLLILYSKQPSTWRGIFSLLGFVGVAIAPELQVQIIVAIGSIVSIIEIIRNETAKTNEVTLPSVELIGTSSPDSAFVNQFNSVQMPADSGDRS